MIIDGIGEPRILRYAREWIRLQNDTVWHLPDKGQLIKACQNKNSQKSKVAVVMMFDDVPPLACRECVSHHYDEGT